MSSHKIHSITSVFRWIATFLVTIPLYLGLKVVMLFTISAVNILSETLIIQSISQGVLGGLVLFIALLAGTAIAPKPKRQAFIALAALWFFVFFTTKIASFAVESYGFPFLDRSILAFFDILGHIAGLLLAWRWAEGKEDG